MRTMKTLTLCALMIMTANLAFAHYVAADYDRSVDFSNYRTFGWAHLPPTASPLMKARIINAINANLQSRGLELVETNADLVISAHTATGQSPECETFFARVPGGWNWYYYWKPEPFVTAVEVFDGDTLVVDVVDTRTQQVVWWAAGNETVRKESLKNVKHLNKSVYEMFEYFPPTGFPAVQPITAAKSGTPSTVRSPNSAE